MFAVLHQMLLSEVQVYALQKDSEVSNETTTVEGGILLALLVIDPIDEVCWVTLRFLFHIFCLWP